MTNKYYFYNESDDKFHIWQKKTVISKANKYASDLDYEVAENDKIGEVTTIDKAIEVLEMVNIVEGKREDYY